MGYKVGVDKKQPALLPPSLDEYVPEEHICRVIQAFTRQLDMIALGYKYGESKNIGNRPYDPRMMLNLYIYGYLHRVRSSRRLRDEAVRNIEVMWLMDGLIPDDKTICNFRKDNNEALRKTFVEFARMCRELKLYGRELIAVDSTKIRANNSRKNNFNRTTIQRELTRIDKQTSEYMNALEQGDSEDNGEEDVPNAAAIKAALKKLKQRKVTIEKQKANLGTEDEVSTIDGDARIMHSGGDERAINVCYNVQTAVDSKHHLIVDFEVTTCPNDYGNLKKMSEKAKEAMEVERVDCLADKGYYEGRDIAACEGSGVRCFVAKPRSGGAKKAKGFTLRSFSYDRENDCYICPCKNRLEYMRTQQCNDGRECRIYGNKTACDKCQVKTECTKSPSRLVYRRPYEDVLEIVDERTRKNRELYRKRQEIVEHPFGTIKAVWGFRQFLCRTKPKVTAETALAYLAYNLRRFINISTANGANPAILLR
jgi:transposase